MLGQLASFHFLIVKKQKKQKKPKNIVGKKKMEKT